jgi:hypothetical protein
LNGTPLTTESIVKITYGKNVLFERQFWKDDFEK